MSGRTRSRIPGLFLFQISFLGAFVHTLDDAAQIVIRINLLNKQNAFKPVQFAQNASRCYTVANSRQEQ